MFSKKFQRKYALTDQGLRNTKKGAFWTVIVNLVVMGGMGINSIEALRGNRKALRGVDLNPRELEILGIDYAGE